MPYETYKIAHHIGAITFSTGLRGADRNLALNLTLKTVSSQRGAGSQKKIIGLDGKIYAPFTDNIPPALCYKTHW